jgi:hypothetical protein
MVVQRDSVDKNLHVLAAFGALSEINAQLDEKSVQSVSELEDYLSHVILKNLKKVRDLKEVNVAEGNIFKITIPVQEMLIDASEQFQARSI